MFDYRCRIEQERNPFPPETIEALWARAKGVPRDVLKFAGMTWEISRQSGYKMVPVEAVEHVAVDIEA
jgi:hypothetical protein